MRAFIELQYIVREKCRARERRHTVADKMSLRQSSSNTSVTVRMLDQDEAAVQMRGRLQWLMPLLMGQLQQRQVEEERHTCRRAVRPDVVLPLVDVKLY